jgi:hypothetical protein
MALAASKGNESECQRCVFVSLHLPSVRLLARTD